MRHSSSRYRFARLLTTATLTLQDQIDWIATSLAQDIRECPNSLNIDLQIFVTRNTLPLALLSEKTGGDSGSSGPALRDSSDEISPNTASPSSPDLDEKKAATTPSALLFATSLREGRPDLGPLLREAVAGAGSNALAINVCGPHAMSSDVKRALRDNQTAFSLGDVAAGKVGHVSLHCEAFVSHLNLHRSLVDLRTDRRRSRPQGW